MSNIPRFYRRENSLNTQEIRKTKDADEKNLSSPKIENTRTKRVKENSDLSKNKLVKKVLNAQTREISSFDEFMSATQDKQSTEVNKINHSLLKGKIEKQLEETKTTNFKLSRELEETKKISKSLAEMLSSLTDKLDTATREITKKDRHMKEISVFLNLSDMKGTQKFRGVQSMNNISSQFDIHENKSEGESRKQKKNSIRNSFKRMFKARSSKESLASMKIIQEAPLTSNNSVGDISDLCKLLREKELTVADLQLEIVAQRNIIKELESKLEDIQKSHQSTVISKRRLSGVGIFTDDYKLINLRASQGNEWEEIMISFYLLQKTKGKKSFMGNLLINKSISWVSLFQNARKIFKNFINLIDSRSNIGIGAESIHALVVGEKSWLVDKNVPVSSPCSHFSGFHDSISILLKGSKQKATDEIAFDLLISNKLITRYMEEITKSRRLILYGPQLSGKFHLATSLAEHIRDITSSKTTVVEIKKIFTSETTVLSTLMMNFVEKNDCKNIIFVVKNIETCKYNYLDVQFRKFFAKIRNLQIYIIGTCRINSKIVKDLEMEYKFKVFRLPLHMEPLENIISRLIVRESINTNNSMINLETDVEIGNFFTSTLVFINDLLESNDKGDKVIGPFIFANCPLSGSKSDWFVRTWNEKVIPILRNSLDSTPKVEPFDWVMEKIPWKISRISLNRLGIIYKRGN